MRKMLSFCALSLDLIAAIAPAFPADDFGIPTYAGFRSDAETQEICSAPDIDLFKDREKSAGIISTKRCYRTSDPLSQVSAFYKKQAGMTGGVSMDMPEMQSAAFCLSEEGACNEVSTGTSISISSPWILASKGKVNKDLLIVIINRVKAKAPAAGQ